MVVFDLLFLALIAPFYRQFVAISVDSEFANLRVVNTTCFHYLLVCMMALCVVATIRVVGLILVIALLTIPPYIAQIFAKRLGLMMLISPIFSVVFCFIGRVLSFYFNIPGGASIILVASLFFFAFSFNFNSLRS